MEHYSQKITSIHEEFTKIEGDLGETEFRAIYIDKTYERLEFLKKDNTKSILKYDTLIINGKSYNNISFFMRKLRVVLKNQ